MKNMSINSNIKESPSNLVSYAFICGRQAKEDYIECKGYINQLPLEQQKEVRVLNLLENLGYPMEELGTYLYKDVIVSTADILANSSNDLFSQQMLVEELNHKYSQFYFDIARNSLDMGLKEFHWLVQRAISNVDYSKGSPMTFSCVYDREPQEMGYVEQTIMISNYVSNMMMSERLNRQIAK